MKMSKLSNQTNSQDPQAVNSRVFVGNLNTFQCSKTDVERMFQRYGRLAGISMHKGYAFVQFTNPFDARNACYGEDGRTVLSQVLDVNMVTEPKPHQTGRKRQNITKTGNDWDYYYDSYYASTLFPSATSPIGVKRQRLMTTSQPRPTLVAPSQAAVAQQQQQIIANKITSAANSLLQLQQQKLLLSANSASNLSLCNNVPSQSSTSLSNNNVTNNGETNCNVNHTPCINNNNTQTLSTTSPANTQIVGPFKVYSNPDILICGNCREMFSELGELLEHKKTYCKLRFTCKCVDEVTMIINKNPSTTTSISLNGENSEDHSDNSLNGICKNGIDESNDSTEGSNNETINEHVNNGKNNNSSTSSNDYTSNGTHDGDIEMNGNKTGLNGSTISVENSPIVLLSSSRSNSPTNECSTIARSCVRSIKIDTTTSNSTLSTLALLSNGTTMTTQ